MVLMGRLETGTVHVSARANYKFILKISLNSCKPGMILAENLHNRVGAVFIKENTILNERIIKKLHELGIENFRVYLKTPATSMSESIKGFKSKYIKNVSQLKDLFEGFSSGSLIDMKKIERISDSIMNQGEDYSLYLKSNTEDNLEEYLYTHSLNVGILVMLIGKWLNFSKDKISLLVKSGLLHDIGKCKIDSKILNKKSSLLPAEYTKIKKHAKYGLDILKNVPDIKKDVLMGIIMHHERTNGSGYPMGLKNEEIHEFARIIAVADVYDAMTSNRVYRQRQSPFYVFEYMNNGVDVGLDTRITLTFLEHVSNYYIGDSFILNTGEHCKVIYINPNIISRPLVQVGERYVDLSQNSELKISSML